MFGEIEQILKLIKNSTYMQLVLEPLLYWGIGIGTLLVLVSFFTREPRMRMTALIVVAASALAIGPYLKHREKGGPAVIFGASRATVERVTKLREDTKWVYQLLAGLAVATMIWGNKEKLGLACTWATVVCGFIAMIFSLWLHAQDTGFHRPGQRAARTARG